MHEVLLENSPFRVHREPTMRKKVEENAPAWVLVIDDGSSLPPVISKLFHKHTEPHGGHLGVQSGNALDAIAQIHPNIVLIMAPSATSRWINLTRQIKALDQAVKTVILSERADVSCAERFLRAGSDAYVLSEDGPDELLSALHDVLAGNLFLSERLLSPVLDGAYKTRPKTNARRFRKHWRLARPRNQLVFCTA